MAAWEPIAIIGRGCVLPSALSPDALWRLVRDGRSALTHASPAEWGLPAEVDREALARETASDVTGRVEAFEQVFSHSGFHVDVDPGLDPVFLWPLHAAREALRESGRDVPKQPVRGAVVLGNLGYPTPSLLRFAETVWRNRAPVDARERFISGLPAALVARALGFVGPAFTLDAACASSLYAIKLACDRLRDGSVDWAIAGGVNHADDFLLHLGFTALGALSPSGQSRPFHREADGLVPVRGAAVVLLARLSDALSRGDRVLGVVRGIGLSNDGRSRGLLVPSMQGQLRAVHHAFEQAGLSPRDVSLVECHATGTTVGDAVEVQTMRRVFEGCTDVPMGSLKSNLGHLLTASAAAGVIKVLSAMQAGERPPTLHAEAPLPELVAPLRVLRRREPWPDDRPRIAGINGFGFGGNNAHLLLEEGRAWARPTNRRLREASADVAVVAMNVRVGAALGLAQLQAALRAGTSLIREGEASAPPFALDLAGLRLPPADLNDALPQQTMVFDAVMSLVRDPGRTGELMRALPPTRTSILVGMQCDAEAARCGLGWRAPESQPGRLATSPLRPAVVVGCMANVVANRLNHQLGLEGPSFALSAEEASGTTALDLGLRALRAHELDTVIVAAVDLSCEPVQRAALRAEGTSTPPGDAVVVMVLERLDDARRHGHPVLAVLSSRASSDATLRYDGGDTGLSWFWGHPHAATGLLHVAAAISACQGGFHLPARPHAAAPWNASITERHLAVRIQAPSQSEAFTVTVSGADEPSPIASTAPAPRHHLVVSPHLEPVVFESNERVLEASALVTRHRARTRRHLEHLTAQHHAHLQFLQHTAMPRLHAANSRSGPLFDRAALERLSTGPISAVLGPAFREVDRYRRVVRLPRPPLLLVDRVTHLAGEPGSMRTGTICTETDVVEGAWYLHHGLMPAGILIESGQADLLLISWLGVDTHTRGERVYRLLGCDLTCHGPLPKVGDTLRYEIHVDGHATQGDVRLFFFHYDCLVNGELRLRVRNGQAGFFTDDELAGSAGVLFDPSRAKPTPNGRLDAGASVSAKRSFTAAALNAFRGGRVSECFGPGFERADAHVRTPSIQGGRLQLIDEVTHFDPQGGPWGRGYLRARLALSPDHWFFAGHFQDDPCMPGTLMFEGGVQAMALYLAAMGFTLERDGFTFEPVRDHEYRLRCRGQATPASRELVYELFVDEVIDGPRPTLFVDLVGSVDGRKAFVCRRMGLRLVPGQVAAVRVEASAPRLFTIEGATREALLESLASATVDLFERRGAPHSAAPLACVLLARDREQLRAELARAQQGVRRAFDTLEPWKTPSGSTFTPRPLGLEGKVAFVYPGMGSAAAGAGRGLFARLPHLLDELTRMGLAIGRELQARLTEPADAVERDAVRIASTSMALSYAMTRLLRRDLELAPQQALGFSVGEASMCVALSLFTSPVQLEQRLAQSPVFRDRLAGPMHAVREEFGLAPHEPLDWSAMILSASAAQVADALRDLARVRLLAIHAPREVMVAGERRACEALAARLGVPALPMPLALAMHTGAARRERQTLRDLHALPITPQPGVDFYSAARAGPLAQTSDAVADALADSFSTTVDFPALVDRAWRDGARLFVEVGARANCSTWIERVLDGKPHACAPLGAIATDEVGSLLRGLAVLATHRVPLNLTVLDAPTTPSPEVRATPPAPLERTEWELVLSTLAAQVLGWSDPNDVPIDTPLPLDSLGLMQLRARLEPRLPRPIATDVLLTHRTVRALAQALEPLGPPRAPVARAKAATAAVHRGAWSQFGMWHLPRHRPSPLSPSELHRRIPILWTRSTMRISGPLDVERLGRALEETFAHHDILRSVVRDAGPHAPPDVVRLEGWSPVLEHHQGFTHQEAFFAQQLDPERGPPARVALFQATALEHRLCLSQHHLFTDGLSLLRFWQELFTRTLGHAPVPAPTASFEQFANAQAAWLASEASRPAIEFWRRTLAGARLLEVPSDRPRVLPTDFRGERVAIAIPAPLTQRVEGLCGTADVTLFSVLLSALTTVLHRETGQDDLLMTTFHANRALPGFPEAFDVMGPVLQDLPLRVTVDPKATAREHLRRVHQVVADALDHGAVPSAFLEHVAHVPVPPARVSVLYQAFTPPSSFQLGPLSLHASEPLGFGAGHASFDLELVLWPAGGELHGVAAYATQLFERSTVERLVAALVAELDRLSQR